MGSTFTRVATVLAVVALAAIGATAGVAANPNQTYTCTKSKKNGQPDVRVSVPESAVSGLTNAGFVCVADTPADEDEGDGTDEGTTDDGPADEVPNDESADDQSSDDHSSAATGPQAFSVPEESRSLYCSTHGGVDRGGADGSGVALDLPDSQGASLVERGLATPAIFYAGVGVSCDVLPGYTYAGFWVDHVGDVVPGVAVYPYYVPTA